MWITKILLIVLTLEVFSVLAVPAPKRPSSSHGGTGSHGGSGSHGDTGSHGSSVSHGGTGSHGSSGSLGGTVIGTGSGTHTKPNANSNADRNLDCKLIFNIGQTSDGKPTVTSIKMPELTRMLKNQGTGTTRDNICNLIFALNPTFISQDLPIKPGYVPIKPTIVQGFEEQARSTHTVDAVTASSVETNKGKDFEHVYEHQLTVWPTDIEEVIDALRPDDQHAIQAYPAWSPIDSHNVQPLYEDQIVVFPELLFDDFETEYDEEVDEQDSWPIASKPPTNPAEEDIKVVENLNLVHLNGTREHKLVLSNGMVNYKKIYNKLVDGKTITVQEGYDSVPIPGTHNTEFNTQFYIADEHGHNVYRVEHNNQRPELPIFLSFREQMAAAKGAGNL